MQFDSNNFPRIPNLHFFARELVAPAGKRKRVVVADHCARGASLGEFRESSPVAGGRVSIRFQEDEMFRAVEQLAMLALEPAFVPGEFAKSLRAETSWLALVGRRWGLIQSNDSWTTVC